MKKINRLMGTLTLAAMLGACGGGPLTTGAAASGADTQAIAVHGDWVIAVADPDGTVVEEVAFRNRFTGHEALSKLLTGAMQITTWDIYIGGLPNACVGPGSANGNCIARNVTAEIGADGESVVLSTTIEVDRASNISVVSTFIRPGILAFSTKALSGRDGPGVVPVEAGQIVQVEVRYTFG